MKGLTTRIGHRIWLPIFLILLWQLVFVNLHNPFFPPPSKIFDDFGYVLTPQWLRVSLISSLTVLALGFFIGSFLGIFFGAVIGENQTLLEVFAPITNFFRSVPSAAKVPVIMAILGIGTATRVCAVSVAVMFPVFMATSRAIATTDIHLLELSRILNYSRLRTLITIRLPSATGEILAGLHAAVQVALFTLVVSEMLGSGVGVGAFVVRSQNSFMIADMWVGIIVIGSLGLCLNELFVFTERRIAPWYFREKRLR